MQARSLHCAKLKYRLISVCTRALKRQVSVSGRQLRVESANSTTDINDTAVTMSSNEQQQTAIWRQ